MLSYYWRKTTSLYLSAAAWQKEQLWLKIKLVMSACDCSNDSVFIKRRLSDPIMWVCGEQLRACAIICFSPEPCEWPTSAFSKLSSMSDRLHKGQRVDIRLLSSHQSALCPQVLCSPAMTLHCWAADSETLSGAWQGTEGALPHWQTQDNTLGVNRVLFCLN